jgi:hypothetical protein
VARDLPVDEYVEALPEAHRALFSRIDGIVLGQFPDAEVVLSYRMPTYRVGARKLHVGGWRHGISLYGWKGSGDGGLTERHPALKTSAGTIQLRPSDGDELTDAELASFARAVLGPLP